MKQKVMKLVVFASIVCIIDKVAGEPCVTYTNFTADSKRSPNHTESVYANKVCDVVLPTKWYRLVGDAGSDLTNDSSVLIDDGCGTSYQRWMNGTIPEVSEGAVDREICMRSIFSTCHSSFTIKVKNCCSFRVYQLKSATNCPQAYCISPSLVPSDNCSHIVWWTTTTVTTTTSTTTSTTTTTTPATTTYTTGVTNVLDDNGNENVTVLDSIEIIIVVLLSVITVAVIAILIVVCKIKSKVNQEPPTPSGQAADAQHDAFNEPVVRGVPPAYALIQRSVGENENPLTSKMDTMRIVRESSILVAVPPDHSNDKALRTDHQQTTYSTLEQVDTAEHFYDTTTETPPQSTSAKAQLKNITEKEVTNSKNFTTTPKASVSGATELKNEIEKKVTT